MTRVLTAGAVLLMTTSALSAAGIERTRNPYGNLFEEGGYLELTFSNVFPDVVGDYPDALGGGDTGNMAGDYFNIGFTYKNDFTDQLSFGLFLNSPYGADADYGAGVYTGLQAEWNSRQLAALLKYKINSNFSVYGGVRYVESEAEIVIPDSLIRGALVADGSAGALFVAGNAAPGSLAYSADGERDGATGYVAGVAYERPEIALRVALTYESELEYEFDTAEVLAGIPGTFSIDDNTTTEVKMPQVITLDFQTGIAQDTLLFGSVQWAEWSVWQVEPPAYEDLLNDRVTGIDSDATTYQLGVGRRFSDDFSGFIRATHEPGNGDVASRLAPTDGRSSLGVGGSYTYENVEMTVGAEYIWLGDATDGSDVEFEDNTAIGIGASFGYRF